VKTGLLVKVTETDELPAYLIIENQFKSAPKKRTKEDLVVDQVRKSKKRKA